MPLELTAAQLAAILEHCRREAPLEACGILAGRDARVSRVHPLTNADRSRTSYLIEPREQLRVMGEIWDRREELLAIFHSHPASPAYPSSRDVELAFYPDSRYIIVSLRNPEPEIRCFLIREGQIAEEPLKITE